jgi:hypothetical protein
MLSGSTAVRSILYNVVKDVKKACPGQMGFLSSIQNLHERNNLPVMTQAVVET